MRNTLLYLAIFFNFTAVFSQDAAVTSLRYAYSSWKINKPQLDKYTLEYANKIEECKALKIANEAEIEALKIEKEKVRQELLKGSFCDQCNRSKSEIELAEKIPFMEHIKNVQGTPIPASPSIIKKRMDEFDSKIQALSFAVMTCEGDAFMINGKIATFTVYVESNVKTATQNVSSINSYLSKELSAIILEKNNAIVKINKMVKEVNDELASLELVGTTLDNLENQYDSEKNQLENNYKQKMNELTTEINNLNSQLEKEVQQEEKTRITGEIAVVKNTMYQSETEYQQSNQILVSNFESKKDELTGNIDSKLNSLVIKMNSEISSGKSNLQNLANNAAKIMNYHSTNIAYINKVIAEMKLDIFVSVSINFNSDRLLHTLSTAVSNTTVKSKIGNDLTNANNNLITCQSLIDDIESVRVRLVTK